MSAQANIVVFDGASTPVTHTLIGAEVFRDATGANKAVWKEALSSVPDYAQLRITQSKKKLPSGITRVSTRVEVPVMEAINAQNSSGYTAPPKVAYIDTVEIVGYFHERSTIAGRRLARQIAVNVAGNVSTTVAAATAGPVAELMDQLIFVS